MGNFLRHYVFHNFFLKLVSLALAVGLWLAVSREEPAELPISVPIEFHNVPENLEISWENIPQAQILVRGPDRVIRRLAPSDMHLEIDLRRANAAERTFDLKNQIRGPRDVEGTSRRDTRPIRPVPSAVRFASQPLGDRAGPGR